MPTVIASQTYGFADGGSGHACVFTAGAPSVGNFDILCVNSDTQVSTPSGFTLSETQLGNQGSYIFTREAAGGETDTATVTTAGNFNTHVIWARVDEASAIDLTESAIAAGAGTSTPAFTSSALAETGELAIAFAALHGFGGAAPATPVWSAGYTEVASGSQGAAGAGAAGFVASKTPAGTAAESPSVSWTNAANDRYILFITLTAIVTVTGTGAIEPGGPAISATGVVVHDGTASLALGGPTLAVSGTIPSSGSYRALLSILEVCADERAESLRRWRDEPMACPNDGEPLRAAPDGSLYCPFDGWRSNR